MIYSDLAEAHGSPFGILTQPEQPPIITTPTNIKPISLGIEGIPSIFTPTVKESFVPSSRPTVEQPMTDDDKLSRILKLIEQNRTGYQPAATQDMVLYIATGVMFLFTFETFVGVGFEMARSGRRGGGY